MEISMFASQRVAVLLTSAAGLMAVSIPFLRAIALYFRARAATRLVLPAQLARAGESVGSGIEPLAVLMVRVLEKALASPDAQDNPSELILDAAKQYTMGEYHTHYAQPLSMYANLLPPVGLTGNAIGMLILLVSKHVADAPLELAALGLAMISTICALTGYALLEALRLRLYGRLLASLEQVARFHSALEAKRTQPPVVSRGSSPAH